VRRLVSRTRAHTHAHTRKEVPFVPLPEPHTGEELSVKCAALDISLNLSGSTEQGVRPAPLLIDKEHLL
jgi:hypothetical protein